MTLDDIRATILDGRTKGIPGTARPFALADIGRQGWNVLREDLPLPLMVLKRSALDHNAEVFGHYLRSHDLSFAPHGKTTMAPQIFAEQLTGGAWGMTAATANQVEVMRAYGVRRIVLANQLVGKANIQTIAAAINADPGFDFYAYVDSIAQLRNLETYLPPLHHPIKLLIEAGTPGGRTGLRTLDEARALAAAIATADPARVRFAGVSMFEGAAPGLDKGTDPVDTFARFVVDVVNALPPSLYAGLPEFILSGGGSSYFDIVAESFRAVRLDIPVRVVLRSGCYVTHDSGSYDRAQEQAKADTHRHDHLPADRWPALEAWAYVQSVPEKGLAFLTMGKRDIPYDSGLPVPIKRYRPGAGFLPVGTVEIFATNDQHAYVRLGPDADWQVGDLIASGVSHPCTAFDKWRFIPIVDDDYAVIDGVLTFF